MFVLRVDSPGISSGDPREMYRAIGASATPIAVWVGPDPPWRSAEWASCLLLPTSPVQLPVCRSGYLQPDVVRVGERVVEFGY